MAKAMQLQPDVVGHVVTSKTGLEEAMKEDIKNVWEAVQESRGFDIFKSAEDIPLTYGPYGSVSAGREFWPFRVIFFQKVERSCGQTVKDRFDFSIDSGQLYLVHSGDLNLALEIFLESHGGHHHHQGGETKKTSKFGAFF